LNQLSRLEEHSNYVRFPIFAAGEALWFLTHVGPHADEIAAAVLIERYATPEWVAEHTSGGVVIVGTMGNEFDEHPDNGTGKARDKKDCAATLVAKSLGVSNLPNVKEILKYLYSADIEGIDVRNGLASCINLLRRVMPHSQIRNINWGLTAFQSMFSVPKKKYVFAVANVSNVVHGHFANRPDIIKLWDDHIAAARKEQSDQFNAAVAELESNGDMREIPGPGKGRKLQLLVIKSDSSEMAKAGRYKGADIVLQMKSTGQTMVHTKKQANLKLYSLILMLRLEEQKALGSVTVTNWQALMKEGDGPMRRWYFHCSGKSGHFILNGSLSTPDVTPTIMPIEKIAELIEISVDINRYEPKMELACQQGICTSTKEKTCSWFNWGLPRCNNNRR
jgi:hypothetical protein